ncbi:MAG: hypothetical protein IJ857_03540 [Lachnospiraceae bacterium]|nr:hypothetical protein [Lachnospiraceae bacterium]
MPKGKKKTKKGHRKPERAGTAEQQGGRRTKAKSRKVEKGIDLVIIASV